MPIQNYDLHKSALVIVFQKMDDLGRHMRRECLDILIHTFHLKPHLGLHKLDLQIKNERKNNLKKQVGDCHQDLELEVKALISPRYATMCK